MSFSRPTVEVMDIKDISLRKYIRSMDSKARRARRAKESQKAHQSRAKVRKEKERVRIKFSSGTTVRISRQAINQVDLVVNIHDGTNDLCDDWTLTPQA
eukprot:5824873-Amphidinium_carterae.2